MLGKSASVAGTTAGAAPSSPCAAASVGVWVPPCAPPAPLQRHTQGGCASRGCRRGWRILRPRGQREGTAAALLAQLVVGGACARRHAHTLVCKLTGACTSCVLGLGLTASCRGWSMEGATASIPISKGECIPHRVGHYIKQGLGASHLPNPQMRAAAGYHSQEPPGIPNLPGYQNPQHLLAQSQVGGRFVTD